MPGHEGFPPFYCVLKGKCDSAEKSFAKCLSVFSNKNSYFITYTELWPRNKHMRFWEQN
jgi:hypothetical protein